MSEQEFFLRTMTAVAQRFLSDYSCDTIGEKRIESICRKSAHIATRMTEIAVAEWEVSHPVYPNSTNTLFSNFDI